MSIHVNMNDDSYMSDDATVNTWQDRTMNDYQAAAAPVAASVAAPPSTPATSAPAPAAGSSRPGTRVISSLEELKALSDPVRLAILDKLMMPLPESADLPVMSVKELAEALQEPQTKLYRHVRQLESVGLIKVASSRMVSGILEQRYQAAQQDLNLAPGFVGESIDEAEGITRAVFDHFRQGFFVAYRARHTPPAGPEQGTSQGPDDGPGSKARMAHAIARLSPARAAEVRAKLQEVLACFDQPDNDDPDAEELSVLIGYYSALENGSLHAKR
jgi:DNA-binding transcriptional ArsR family regulator